MKINKFLFLLFLILCAVVTACNSNDDHENDKLNQSIIGIWISEEGEAIFNSDGSGSLYDYDRDEEYDFTYKVKGNKLTIILAEEYDIELYYEITIKGDVMEAIEIEEGGTTIFYRHNNNDSNDHNSTSTKIIGTWKSSVDEFTFYSNGRGINRELNGEDEYSFTYSILENKITLTFPNGTKVTCSILMYDNVMYITTNDETIKYIKE